MTPSEKLAFKAVYVEAKKEVGICKEKVAKYSSEHNLHLTNIWKRRLCDTEHTLKDFELFLSLFPNLKEFCYEESVVLNG